MANKASRNLESMVYDLLAKRVADKVLEPVAAPNHKPSGAFAKLSQINSTNATHRTNYLKSMGGRYGTSYEDYDYNMAEIAQLEDNESYAFLAFNKHMETCMKEGFYISSLSDKHVAHVKQRLYEIVLNSGQGLYSIINEIVRDIIKYANAYVSLVRDKERTSGSTYHYRGRKLDPIAGIFIVDPPCIKVRRNKDGKPISYKQTRIGNSFYASAGNKVYPAHNIIHLHINRKGGHAYGMPGSIPVIEDVRALRRLEEMVEMLASSHCFPLYHYIVGTPDIPGSPDEVELVKEHVEQMPTEGSLVTTERHTIKVIGAEGKALDIKPYLEYFEKRVLSGLGISEITIGRGGAANKQTAASLDRTMQDRCSYINKQIEDQLTHTLILELLLDGKLPLTVADHTEFSFNQLDKEEQRAHETHILNLYQSNLLGADEARAAIGRRGKIKPGESYDQVVAIPHEEASAKIQEKTQVAVNKAKPATGTAAKNRTKSKAQPTNQHGTKTKSRVTANNFADSLIDVALDHFEDIYKLNIDTSDYSPIMRTIFAHAIETIADQLKDVYSGYNCAIDPKTEPAIIVDCMQKDFGADIKAIVDAIDSGDKAATLSLINNYRVNFKEYLANITEPMEETNE